uniref:Calmodulin-lysine N-methyltransferase n=1 Tax=Neolamprologus brichardi TaxID=32507 RepID=A0A3Q4H5A3_NEOBR
MDRDSSGAAERTEPASPLGKNIHEDTLAADSRASLSGTCTNTDVARARWTLLRQVCKHRTLMVFMFQACCIIIYIFVSLRDNMGPLRVNEVLNSFDNTGNVCKYMLYLTRHCLCNVFEGAVCELGGGMTCLGGLMVILVVFCHLPLRYSTLVSLLCVCYRVVRWDCEMDISALEGHFDFIMCADCLFLDQYRASLVDAIRRLLQPSGMALVFAPQRGETLRLFCQLAQQAGFCISQHQQYDAQVWDVHLKVRNMSKKGKTTFIQHEVELITVLLKIVVHTYGRRTVCL